MSAADAGPALMVTALVLTFSAGILAINVGSMRTARADDRLRVAAFVVFGFAVGLAIAGIWTLAAAGVFR